MCRADVLPAAGETLARLLADMVDVLCAETGADPADVLVGPVDFGLPAGTAET